MEQNRDIIVIGASLGGIEALQALVAALPADLPAAVFVVQHVAAESPGVLAGILDRRGPLPSVTAEDGMPILPGRIAVAPPDRHLLVTGRGARVVFGPRENRSRPAIDPLFRTAAANFGSRVIGVILTGLLDDGAAGLSAVHRCGGAALVQDPDEAAHSDMPRNALAAVPHARRHSLDELGRELAHIARAAAPPPVAVPESLRLEAELTERAMVNHDWTELPGRATDFTCPECRGAIREVSGDSTHRYRCRVGHAYTAETLIAGQDNAVEEALWVALQTLDERVQMLEGMARADEERGWHRSAASATSRAAETRGYAQRLREFIQQLGIAAPARH